MNASNAGQSGEQQLDTEFALTLARVRLIQTQEVLRLWLDDHPDQKAVNKAIEAIGTARAIVKNLETSLPQQRASRL